MAVYHLKVSIGSRAGGQSAGAKADYIEREGNYEKDREELEHKEHGNMPEWAKDDPHSYWKAADEHERANGRLYREVQFALPKELNEEQRRELASGFAKRLTEGRAATLHAGRPSRRRGEPPRAPDVLGAGQRWHRAQPGAVVPAAQRGGPGGRAEHENPGRVGAGLDGQDPRGVGAGGEWGAGAGPVTGSGSITAA